MFNVSLKICFIYQVLIILSSGNAFNFYFFNPRNVDLFPTMHIASSGAKVEAGYQDMKYSRYVKYKSFKGK